MGCGPVPQLAPRNMESIQNLEPSSLPNGNVYPEGAHKYSQLGEQAFTSIMHELMDKVDFGSRRAVLLLDVTGPWTHFYEAFIHYQQSCKTHMMFLSAFSNVDEKDWWENAVTEDMICRMESGLLSEAPGMSDLQAEPPSSCVAPTKPLLK